MAEIKDDTFTEGSDTSLESHTSDSGGGWQSGVHETNVMTVLTASGELSKDAAGSGVGVGDETPGSANQTNEVNGKTVGTAAGDKFGPTVRQNTAASQSQYMTEVKGNADYNLTKLVADAYTVLDTYAIGGGFSASTYYDAKVDVAGSSLEGFLDGVSRVTATDSDVTAVDHIGVYFKGANPRITSLLASDDTGDGGVLVAGSLSLIGVGI